MRRGERGSVLLALLFWSLASLLVLGVAASLRRFQDLRRVREEVALLSHELGEGLRLAVHGWVTYLGSVHTRSSPSLDELWLQRFWDTYRSPVLTDGRQGVLRCLGERQLDGRLERHLECQLCLERGGMSARAVLGWTVHEGRLPASLLGSCVLDGAQGPPWAYPLPSEGALRAGGGHEWGREAVWWSFMGLAGEPDPSWLWRSAGMGGEPGELAPGLHLLKEGGVVRGLWWEGHLDRLVLSGTGAGEQSLELLAGETRWCIRYHPGAASWHLNDEDQEGVFPQILVVHGDVRSLSCGPQGMGPCQTELTLLISGRVRQEGNLFWGGGGRGVVTLVCGWDLLLGTEATYLLAGGGSALLSEVQLMVQGRVGAEGDGTWTVRGALVADGVDGALSLQLEAEPWVGVSADLRSAPCRLLACPQWLLGEVGS